MSLQQFSLSKRAVLFIVASIAAFMMTVVFVVRPIYGYGMPVAWFVLGCTCLTLINYKRQPNPSA
ncbi:MAG: hypothetical protein IT324_13105 [Anaerolineae bacterium]|nr:hypothetical protein [Anaerolineae bacterium]